MIALNSGLAALTSFQASELLAFAVQLLDLPTEAAHFLCSLSGIGSWIVSDDPIRATGRRLDPETLHFVVFREPFDFDPLTEVKLVFAPV